MLLYKKNNRWLKPLLCIGIILCSLLFPALPYSALTPPEELNYITYIGQYADVAYDIATDSDDNIIVAGYTQLDANYAFFTIKYNPTLDTELWTAQYNSPYHEEAHAVAVDSEDNVIVTGSRHNATTVDDDFYTIKYSPEGNELWSRSYNSGEEDIAWGVITDNEDNIIITGISSNNYGTIKYNSQGHQEWIQIYDSGDKDCAQSVATDCNGDIIVTGYCYQGYNTYGYTIKYTPDGQEVWNQTYQQGINVFWYDVTVDSSDEIIVTGSRWNDLTRSDYCTKKYSTNGTELWMATFSGPNEDKARAVTVDAFDHIFITGSSYDLSLRNNYCTIKYNSAGTQLWKKTYDRGIYENDYSYGITVDGSNKLIVTGASTGQHDYDYLTIKYGEFPVANFFFEPDTPTDLDLIQFTDTSTDTDGDIIEWLWDFGDENTSQQQYPTHQYAEDGIYLVSLTVTDDDSMQNTTIQEITIANEPPHVDFSWEQIGEPEDQRILFISEAEDLDGEIITWLWDFGDNTTDTGDIAIHSYDQQGPFQVSHTVIDNDHAENTSMQTITVEDIIPPELTDNSNTQAFTGDLFTFNTTVTDNVAVESVQVTYWYGTDPETSENLTHISEQYWNLTITIQDTLELFHYYLTAYDTNQNQNTTQTQHIQIIDNDAPSFQDHTPAEAYAGDPFEFNASVVDNIELADVWVIYQIDGGTLHNMSMSPSSGGFWHYSLFIDLSFSLLTYHMGARDTSNNLITSPQSNVSIIPNTPPETPHDPTPLHEQTNVSITPDLTWTSNDSDPGDTVLYDIYFGTTQQPGKVAANHSFSSYILGPLSYEQTYFWKIIAWDNHNIPSEGPLWMFTTKINEPPQVDDIPNQTILEDNTFTIVPLDDYVEDAEDPDEAINWSYEGNTELLISIDERLATITAPAPHWYGQETITFTATDTQGLNTSDQAIFTVTSVNDPPVVDDIPDQTVDEGGSFTQIPLDNYVSDVEDPDENLTWEYSGNTELSVAINDDHIATITIPHDQWYGEEVITFQATDTGDLTDADPVTFTVSGINDPPVVQDIPDQMIMEGGSFILIHLDDYVEDIDDPDEDLLWTYQGESELLVDINQRILHIQVPNPDWYGAETITFRATDTGGLWDEDNITFTVVNINDPPIVTDIPDQTIQEGDTFALITLDDYVEDVDNADEDMDWSYTGNTDLIVSINNRVATITPPDDDWYGDETITFRATDPGALFSENSATFTVTTVNDPPIVDDIPDQTINEGETFQIIELDAYVEDVEDPDENISWSYSGNSELSVDIIDHLATITTPDTDWYGQEHITFKASDTGGLNDSDLVVFTVLPVNDPPGVADIPDQTIDEGASFVAIILDEYVTDIDDPDEDITWSYEGNSELQVAIIDQIAYVTAPHPDWYGAEIITFTATDPGELNDSVNALFTITSVNDVPLAFNDSYETNEDTPLIIISPGVLNNDTDIDGPLPLEAYLIDDVSHGVLVLYNNGSFSYIPYQDWYGVDTFCYQAYDGQEFSTSAIVEITVQPVNDPPVALNDTVSIDEDCIQWIAVLNNDGDIDGFLDPSTVTITHDPTYGNTNINDSTGEIQYIPDPQYYGPDIFAYLVFDDQGAFSNEAFVEITIEPINDPPIIENIPDQTIEEGESFTQIPLDDYVSDVEDPDENLTWEYNGNSALTVNITNHIATIELPYSDWFGTETITFKATDTEGLWDDDEVVCTVNPENDPPVVDAIPNQTIYEGETFIPISLDDYVEDVEDDDADILWNYSGNTALLVNITDHIATITVPHPDWYGQETICFIATDTGGLNDSTNVTFTVLSVNDPPIAHDDWYQCDEDTNVRIDASGVLSNDTDIDGPQDLTAHLETDVTHGNLTLYANGSFVYLPESQWFGSVFFTYQTYDGENYSTSATVHIDITSVNDPPVVEDIPNQTIVEGDTFTAISLNEFVEDVEDPDEAIIWTCTGEIDLIVDITNQIATITLPSPEWSGSETLLFTANDTGGLTDADTAMFTVNEINDPPIVYEIPNQTIDEGAAFTTIPLDDYVEDAEDPDEAINWSYQGNTELLVSIEDRVATITAPYPDWYGQETMTFTAIDTYGANASTNATFTILPINDAPVANNDTYEVIENTTDNPLTVLDNDSDIENDYLIISNVSTPSHGSLFFTDQMIFYTPNSSYVGVDGFNYTITDGNNGYATAHVNITVLHLDNMPPYTPSNPSPSDGAQGINPGITISWTGGDPNVNDTVTYDVYFGQNPTPSKIISNTSQTSFYPVLNYDTYYFWKIIAWDSHDESAESPVWVFRTKDYVQQGGGGETQDPYVPPPQPPNKLPIADLSVGEPYVGYVNEFIPFDGTESYDPDGTIVRWLWDFGDGSTGTGKMIYHFFTKPGIFNITLTVTDNRDGQATDTTTAVITIPNNPPSPPDIQGPISGEKNSSYEYTVVSTDLDNDFISYCINWGDGTETQSEYMEQNISFTTSHHWDHAGVFTIDVAAYDSNNASSSHVQVFMCIDAMFVGDYGYLIDTNNDGIYDVFYSNISDRENTMLYDFEGRYLLDVDYDGIFDYLFDSTTDDIFPYEDPVEESTDQDYTGFLLFLVIIIVLFILGVLIIYKRENIRAFLAGLGSSMHSSKKKPYTSASMAQIEDDVDSIIENL